MIKVIFLGTQFLGRSYPIPVFVEMPLSLSSNSFSILCGELYSVF